jgi:hypothetical protein
VLSHFTTSPEESVVGGTLPECWLPLEGSNLGSRIQSPLSFH